MSSPDFAQAVTKLLARPAPTVHPDQLDLFGSAKPPLDNDGQLWEADAHEAE